MRKIHEELSYSIPPNRFQTIGQHAGSDLEVPGSTLCAEFFVSRSAPVEQLDVTESTSKFIDQADLSTIEEQLTTDCGICAQVSWVGLEVSLAYS